ncbi:MAG: NAD(P)-dependent dehydrogenase (short-subunit alcohol dehydrogenase family) [Paraglaciecola psychrophila]|jgi:NAD(P)-dependent dehydrogenase (short-subunit alcohol dehydrogenase family)
MSHWLKEGNTAVITGGASGLGLEAARQYVRVGMNVIIADNNALALQVAVAELQQLASSFQGQILGHHCDVASLAAVEALRDIVITQFGAVHCLMNNAGAAISVGAPWENLDDLKKTLSVNLWGVIHGCYVFIPAMLASKEPAVVINTGSKQGITRPPGNYAYNLSKVGVLAYTESIAEALRHVTDCKLSAHLLVPGFVYTPMVSARLPEQPAMAWTAEQTINFMLPCIERGDFYVICPDNAVTRDIDEKRIQWNADDLIKNRPALSRWHADFEQTFEDFMAD